MLVILSTVSVAKINEIENFDQDTTDIDTKTNVTIIYDFHTDSDSETDLICVNNQDHGQICFEQTLNISKSELDEIIKEITMLWEQFKQSTSAKEKMGIFKEILQIETDIGLLPSSFTLEKINETALMLSKLFRQYQKNIKSTDMNGGSEGGNNVDLLDFDDPFIGFGTAACVVAPYAQVFAFPIGQVFIEATSSQFPIFGEMSIDFVTTIFAAWMQIQISHAAAGLGWAISFIPPYSKIWIGPYYAMWGLIGGMSLTIYVKSGPAAVSILDLCLWGGAANVILPFQIPT